MSRGRDLLSAQRKTFRGKRLPPLGPPPEWLEADEIQAWHDLAVAAPDVLTVADSFLIAMLAAEVARWRREDLGYAELRELYRWMGRYFVPMRLRRDLLFSNRPHRT